MAHLARRVHRQQAHAHVDRQDPQAGRRDRADRRPARHRVVADEVLRGNARRCARAIPQGNALAVRRVTLLRVDLDDRAAAHHRTVIRIVVARVVRVHRVRGVCAHARGGGEHALEAILVPAQSLRRAAQHRLQDRAGRARARFRAHLLVIEAHEHRDVSARRGALRRQALKGHQARVHARQVVLARGRDELALVAEEARPLAGGEDQVEGRDLRGVVQARRARHVLQQVAVRVIHRPHRVQVLLRIQLQAARVDVAIQVNRQLRDARNRARAG